MPFYVASTKEHSSTGLVQFYVSATTESKSTRVSGIAITRGPPRLRLFSSVWDVPKMPFGSYSVKITATYSAIETLTPK